MEAFWEGEEEEAIFGGWGGGFLMWVGGGDSGDSWQLARSKNGKCLCSWIGEGHPHFLIGFVFFLHINKHIFGWIRHKILKGSNKLPHEI